VRRSSAGEEDREEYAEHPREAFPSKHLPSGSPAASSSRPAALRPGLASGFVLSLGVQRVHRRTPHVCYGASGGFVPLRRRLGLSYGFPNGPVMGSPGLLDRMWELRLRKQAGRSP
jgi:hypothetical protein